MSIGSYEGLLGFASDTSLSSSRARTVLSKMQLVDGKHYMSRAQFIIKQVLDGRVPRSKEDTHYDRRRDVMTEPKTVYMLKDLDEGNYYEVTKTEYKFALYLIENEFCTLERVESQIRKELEEEQKQSAIRLEKERVEKELKEAKALELKRNKEWLSNAKFSFSNKFMLQIAKNIYLNHLNEYSPTRARELLFCIFNIGNEYCRGVLLDWVTIHNPATVKIFESVTGVSLPRTAGKLRDAIKSLEVSNYSEPVHIPLSKKFSGLNEVYGFDKSGWFNVYMGVGYSFSGIDYHLVGVSDRYLMISARGAYITYVSSKEEAETFIESNKRLIISRDVEAEKNFLELESVLESKLGYPTGNL